MSKVSVSIVMPVYNVEDYLTESLNSVVNQSFKDFELIIVNDGSTDKSEAIIYNFIQKNPDIIVKYIQQGNAGQSVARNKAISISRGEYLYFFDSDDIIDSQAIELFYNKSKKYNLDLLLFSGQSFVEAGGLQANTYNFNYLKKNNYPIVMDGESLFIELINNNDYSTSPCLYFVKKSLLMNKNILFYEGIIHEDALFTFQLILSATRTKVINEVYFYRRIRPNSTMTSKDYTKKFIGIYTVLIEMLEFIKNMDSSNQNLCVAILNRISGVYGDAANQYIYMNHIEQEKYLRQYRHLIAIGEEYNYFERKDYVLFGNDLKLYTFLRKGFDYLKQRKGK